MDCSEAMPPGGEITVLCPRTISADQKDPFRCALQSLRPRLDDIVFVVHDQSVLRELEHVAGIFARLVMVNSMLPRIDPCILFCASDRWGGFAFHGSDEPMVLTHRAAKALRRDYVKQRKKF